MIDNEFSGRIGTIYNTDEYDIYDHTSDYVDDLRDLGSIRDYGKKKILPVKIGQQSNSTNFLYPKKGCIEKKRGQQSCYNSLCQYCTQMRMEDKIWNNELKLAKKNLVVPQPLAASFKKGKFKQGGLTEKEKEYISQDRLIKEEIERETVNDLFDSAEKYNPSLYGDNYQTYQEKAKLLGDDPQALQWQYKFVNPDEIPKPYRNTEMYDQYPQVYYDNNYEEDGDFPFRYAYTAKGGKPYRQMLTDHVLLTL